MINQDFDALYSKSYGSFGYRPILAPVLITIKPDIFQHYQPHKLPQFMQSKPMQINKYSDCSLPYEKLNLS